jgi:hypothetical protein
MGLRAVDYDFTPCSCHASAGEGEAGHSFGEDLRCTKRLRAEPGAPRCGRSWFHQQRRPLPCRYPVRTKPRRVKGRFVGEDAEE